MTKKTVWNLDLLAEKIFRTKFYKKHEDPKLDFHAILCESIKQEQTADVLLEQVKLLPALYNHSKWPYRWGLYTDKNQFNRIKQESVQDIENLFAGKRANINQILGYLWRCAEYDCFPMGVCQKLLNLLYDIQDEKESPNTLSCFDGLTEHKVITASIGRYLISVYKVLATQKQYEKAAHDAILGFTTCEQYRLQEYPYCIHYLLGHNRIVESALELHKKAPCPEKVLTLHQHTCTMELQNLTETMIEFLLVCYSRIYFCDLVI